MASRTQRRSGHILWGAHNGGAQPREHIIPYIHRLHQALGEVPA